MAPPRVSQKAWAAKNPPRDGETFDEYKARYEEDTTPTLMERGISQVRDAGRGVVSGGFRGLGSTVRAIGELTGSRTLRSGGSDMEKLADAYDVGAMDDPTSVGANVGRFAGRAGFEVASAMGGAGVAKNVLLKGAPLIAKAAPRLAVRARQLGRGVETGTKLQRALKTAAISAPVDVVQGVGQGEGMVLPGMAGAVAENVLFSGAGGGLSAIADARKAAQAKRAKDAAEAKTAKRTAYEDADLVGPYPASPFTPRRLLTAGAVQEPAIPMGGRVASAAERGVAVVPYQQNPALPVRGAREAAEEVSAEIQAAREQLEGLSEADKRRWIAFNMPDATEEELLQLITEGLPVKAGRGTTRLPLQPEEAAALRGSRGVRPSMARPNRRGGADAQLLATLGGAGVGAGVGAATGDTPESRMARALAGAGIGAGLGMGATRFFGRGVTSTTPDPTGATMREAQQEVLRGVVKQGEIKRPKMAAEAGPMPENRVPLLDRLTDGFDPGVRTMMGDRISRLEPMIQRPRTEKEFYTEVEKAAGENDVRSLLSIDPKKASAAEAGAVLSVHRDFRAEISRLVDAAKKTTDPDEIARIAQQIDSLDATSDRLLQQILRFDTEAGRSLQSRRYAAAKITDPTYWYVKGTRAKGGELLSDAEKATIDKLSRAGDPDALLKYMAGLQRVSIPEQIAQLRAAGLLTAIPGRLRDFISTSANYASTILQRYPAAAADILLSAQVAKKLGGDAAKFRSVAAPTRDEFAAGLAGARRGLEAAKQSMGFGQKSFDEWVNFIRTAEIDESMARALDIPSTINIDMFSRVLGGKGATLDAIADTYSKSVMRLSGVSDKILSLSALDGAMVEEARLAAVRQGLKGAEADTFVKQLLDNPTDEMKLNAILTAKYVTFTNDGRLAEGIAGAIERMAAAAGRKGTGTEALVRAGARFLMPFRRTPANILSRALEYTPGTGLATIPKAAVEWHRELLKAASGSLPPELAKRQRRLIDLTTKQMTGMGLFALGAKFYQDGLLTGEYPADPAEQEQWRLEGKQPESLLVNGQWVPISRISPYGGVMTLAASVMKEQEDNAGMSASDQLAELGLTTARSVLNQPMVTGPKEALEALTNRSQGSGQGVGSRFATNVAGSFVPSFIAQAARAEGKQRMPQGPMEAITSRIPGLQDTAPERLNIFGEPVQKAEGLLNTMVNPLTGTPDQRQRDPLIKEIADLGMNIAPLRRKKGEDLDMYQYRQREAGRFVREDLTALVSGPDWAQTPPEERRRMINATIRQARQDLETYLKENFSVPPSQDEG